MRSSAVQPGQIMGRAMPIRLAVLAAASFAAACVGKPAPPVPSGSPSQAVFEASKPESALAPSLTPAAVPFKAKGEADRLVEAVLAARDRLAPEKRAGVTRVLGEAIAAAKDEAFRARWAARLDLPVRPQAATAFADVSIRTLMAEQGWAELVRRAETAAPPFNMGRPEAMAAALAHAPDAEARRALKSLMFDLARTKTTRGGLGDNFEKGDFGHVLAEAAMRDCDLVQFDRAVALTPVPDNLRYAFWRARIAGGADLLTTRLAKEAGEADSTPVLQAIDGLAPLLALGYCKA